MACYKQFTFGKACALDDCELHPFTASGTDDYVVGICYASDLCYCLTSVKNNAGTESYFKKYNPDTNALDLKATIVGALKGDLVYDPIRQKFVDSTDTDIIVFDPLTDAVTSFAHGLTAGQVAKFLWNDQMGKIVGETGLDAFTCEQYGIIDIDINTVTPMGALPLKSGAVARPWPWVLHPSSNTIYGTQYATPSGGLWKFNFDTGIGAWVNAAYGNGVGYDPDRDLILSFSDKVFETDPATGTIVYSGNIDPDFDPLGDMTERAVYVPSIHQFAAAGSWVTDGEPVLGLYNPDTRSTEVVDTDYAYYQVILLTDLGSAIGRCYDKSNWPEGVRRVCIS